MDLKNLSLEQLFALNKAVCAEISAKQAVAKVTAIATMSVGDPVSWESNKYGHQTGKVTKVLRTNVDVTDSKGRPWRIPANALTHI